MTSRPILLPLVGLLSAVEIEELLFDTAEAL